MNWGHSSAEEHSLSLPQPPISSSELYSRNSLRNAHISSAYSAEGRSNKSPDERRRGCAKEMLRLVLENANELGLERVMVTCKVGNIASERTILANGGVFERELEDGSGHRIKRYWIEF